MSRPPRRDGGWIRHPQCGWCVGVSGGPRRRSWPRLHVRPPGSSIPTLGRWSHRRWQRRSPSVGRPATSRARGPPRQSGFRFSLWPSLGNSASPGKTYLMLKKLSGFSTGHRVCDRWLLFLPPASELDNGGHHPRTPPARCGIFLAQRGVAAAARPPRARSSPGFQGPAEFGVRDGEQGRECARQGAVAAVSGIAALPYAPM